MFKYKLIAKSFSNLNKKSPLPNFMTQYKSLLDKAAFITEELLPRKVTDTAQLRNYLKMDNISPNVKMEGNIPIDSINAGTFAPCWDLLVRGGKQWRPMLGLIIANYFRIDIAEVERNKLLYRMLALTELTHNASLIIDDVEDKSEYRRNQKCVHLKFGEDIAINAGIAMLYFPVYKIISDIKDEGLKAKIADAYFEEMTAIHLGQGWDIEMKVGNRIPTVENYKDTVICKTGVCPRLMVKLIRILVNQYDASHNEIFSELVNLIDNLSIAFQIRDDVLNITPSVLSQGKGFLGEDIFEGKLTLMVLHTLNGNNSNKEKLKQILLMKTKDENLIREAIEILKSNGSLDYADKIMNDHVKIVEEKCEVLMSKDEKLVKREVVGDIKKLMDFLINRNI